MTFRQDDLGHNPITSFFRSAFLWKDLGESVAAPVGSEQCSKRWLSVSKRGSSDRKNEGSEPCDLLEPCSVHKSLVSTVEEGLGCAIQRAKSKILDMASANTLEICCSLARWPTASFQEHDVRIALLSLDSARPTRPNGVTIAVHACLRTDSNSTVNMRRNKFNLDN